MPKRFKRAVLALVCSFAMLVAAGAIYQWFSEQSDRKLIPGELVSIDGHEFHLLCRGSGRPLVLLENGLTTAYTDWMATIDAVSEFTEVCTYDRLGLGWSSRNDRPTASADVVNYLHTIVQQEKLTGPYVLVGFSAGGLYVRKYYAAHPQGVAGMVLVDSSHEQQDRRMDVPDVGLNMIRLCNALAWSGFVRALRLLEDEVPPSFDARLAEEQRALFYRTGFCHGMLLQRRDIKLDTAAAESPVGLGELPLTVIQAGVPLSRTRYAAQFSPDSLAQHDRVWPQLQRELVALSTNSEHWVAEHSDHSIPVNQPEIIIRAIREMVARIRVDNR